MDRSKSRLLRSLRRGQMQAKGQRWSLPSLFRRVGAGCFWGVIDMLAKATTTRVVSVMMRKQSYVGIAASSFFDISLSPYI